MISLAITTTALGPLYALRSLDVESAGLMLAAPVSLAQGWRLLVQKIIMAPEDAYSERTAERAVLKSEWLLQQEQEAIRSGLSVVYVHTHPWAENALVFSKRDERFHRDIERYLAHRMPGRPHMSLLIGRRKMTARPLCFTDSVRVMEVGRDLVFHYDESAAPGLDEETFDRQIRLLGQTGQDFLGRLKVAVVGLGGTGSILVQQLAHLGVNDFTLIDGDEFEITNRNRLIGSETGDQAGLQKVDIADRQIRRIRAAPEITPVYESVLKLNAWKRLLEVDIVFCCTDTHASRNLLNQIAYQFYMPCIDMGSVIKVKEGKVTNIVGRVQMLSPGLPCLHCRGAVDPKRVAEELASEEQRRSNPYLTGDQTEKQPAVLPLNAVSVSLASQMLLNMILKLSDSPRLLDYDAITGSVRATRLNQAAGCIACSAENALGKGLSRGWPLPAHPHD